MKLLIKLAINAVAVLVAAYFIPGVQVYSFVDAVMVAAVLAFLNTFVKPVVKFLAFPITILTFGLFLLVLNAVMVLVADYFLTGFSTGGFINALIFSVVLSVATYILELILGVD
jgi:putative membrane protein